MPWTSPWSERTIADVDATCLDLGTEGRNADRRHHARRRHHLPVGRGRSAARRRRRRASGGSVVQPPTCRTGPSTSPTTTSDFATTARHPSLACGPWTNRSSGDGSGWAPRSLFGLGEMATPGAFFLAPFADRRRRGVGASPSPTCRSPASGPPSSASRSAAFVALRPLARRLDRHGGSDGIGSRRLIGRDGVVLQEIVPGHLGRGPHRPGGVAGRVHRPVPIAGGTVRARHRGRGHPRRSSPPTRSTTS